MYGYPDNGQVFQKAPAVTPKPEGAIRGIALVPMRLSSVTTFDHDNFEQRRANEGAGVAYDPESLLTGAEAEAGLDYDCPRNRGANWTEPNSLWALTVAGSEQGVGTADIPLIFPRQKRLKQAKPQAKTQIAA